MIFLLLFFQVLDDKILQLLNRDHGVAESLDCLKKACIVFPRRTSVDLLFGTPDQSVLSWRRDLETILPLLDDHVSLYQLTLERGTKLFQQVNNNEVHIPSSDAVADMYEFALDFLDNNGFKQYEVSNFARSLEAQSVHNKCYWYGKQYIGIGPGAHGRFVPTGLGFTSREARVQTLEPDPWMWEVEKRGHGTRRREIQSKLTVLSELVASALRTCDGLQQKDWDIFSNELSLYDCFRNCSSLDYIFNAKLLVLQKEKLFASRDGLKVLDSILPKVLNCLAERCSGSVIR